MTLRNVSAVATALLIWNYNREEKKQVWLKEERKKKQNASTQNKTASIQLFYSQPGSGNCVRAEVCVWTQPHHRAARWKRWTVGRLDPPSSAAGISNAAAPLAGVVLKVKDKASQFAALCATVSVCVWCLFSCFFSDEGKTLIGCKHVTVEAPIRRENWWYVKPKHTFCELRTHFVIRASNFKQQPHTREKWLLESNTSLLF